MTTLLLVMFIEPSVDLPSPGDPLLGASFLSMSEHTCEVRGLGSEKPVYSMEVFEYESYTGEPRDLYIVSTTGTRVAHTLCVHHVHVKGRGWCWLTTQPECFPDEPHLITDDPSFRCIFGGLVDVAISPECEDAVLGELAVGGESFQPLRSDGWVGAIWISNAPTTTGRLWAFSNRADLPQWDSDTVFLAEGLGRDPVFGTLSPCKPPPN